jgi:flavin reductase (DIM6/NTAB) family NADH-FMN oxidoreductase RutF
MQRQGSRCREEVEQVQMKVPLEKSTKLLSPRITFLITSLNEKGNVNAAPFSWVNAFSRNPPMIYVGIATENKGTLPNIRKTKEFVANLVSEDFAEKAVMCEIKSADKLKQSGLNLIESENVSVPGIREAKTRLECRLVKVIDIEGADHALVIGKIVSAFCDSITGKDSPDLERIKPLMHVGGEDFRCVGKEMKLKRYK